jgi:hypothetical protein
MLTRHASAGLSLMRIKTGSGLRQPGLTAFARAALTRMKGLTPLIFMTAVKPKVVMEISNPYVHGAGSSHPEATILFLSDVTGRTGALTSNKLTEAAGEACMGRG